MDYYGGQGEGYYEGVKYDKVVETLDYWYKKSVIESAQYVEESWFDENYTKEDHEKLLIKIKKFTSVGDL